MIPRSTKSAFADFASDGEDSISTPTSGAPPAQLDPSALQQHPSKWSLRTPLPIYTPTRHGSFQRSGSAAAIRPLHTPKQHQRRPSGPGTNATIAFERATNMASDSSNHNNNSSTHNRPPPLPGASVLGASNGSFSVFASTTVNPLSESRMALYTSVNWPTKPVNSLVSLFEHGFDAPPQRLGGSTTTSTASTTTTSKRAPPPLRDFSTAEPTSVISASDKPADDDFGEPMTPLTQATGFVNAPTPGGAPQTILPPVIVPATPLFTTSPQINSPTLNISNKPSLATHFTRNQFNAATIPFHRMKPYLTYVPQSEPADMPYRKLSEVLPGLHLSGEAAVTERDRLLPQGIKLIITMNGDKHVAPYRVYEYNPDKGKFQHRKIRSRDEFVQEMKEEFTRLYRSGSCPGCCPNSTTSSNGVFSPVSSSAFATTITNASTNPQPASFSCEACGITAIPTSDEPPLVYAVREHLGACEDEERLQSYLAAQQTTPSSSTSGVSIPPPATPTTITPDRYPKTKIFVRSIAADDSPVYDLSPHFLEISCLIHIVLEEHRRVQLLWGARQVKREDANMGTRDDLLKETLPFHCPGVAIHCLAGVSRSTSVLAAYLMKLTRVDVEEILACIKNRRVIINPNPGFRRQLATWQLQKYFIAHDEGACAMIARQIAQASSNTAEASSLPCSTSTTERLDQGIGRLAIEEQIRTLEGLLTVYATTNRSTRERRNFGIIIKHLCVEPDRDSDAPTQPSLPLHEVTKLVVMFLREQVLNEIHVDCPGLFTNWCEIVGSIIGHCGGRAMASTLLKVIAEKLQCRFTAVEMYRANLSPIVCIACDALFGVSFIRTYEALAHEAEEANRPIRRTGKYSEATKELLHRLTPMESSITSAELSALSSGPCSPMLADNGGGGVAAGGGLYCGPNAMDPLLALHHANVSTGLPRMKELLSAALPPCPCGVDNCDCEVPQVIRLTYLLNASTGRESSGDGQAEVGSGDDEHLPSFQSQSGNSPIANIPLANFTIPEPGSKRTRALQQQDAEESITTGVSSSSMSIVVAPARDPSYDVRGRTPATAAKLVPLTMALDLYGGDGDAEASMDLDATPVHTRGTSMPQNIVVSYPFLDCMASFAVWEREAPSVITPAELAEALGVPVSTIGGPEGRHSGSGGGADVISSNSLRSGGLTLQLPSRRRGQKDEAQITIATGPSAEEEAAFQDCMARLTAKQKQAIASNAILQITKICNKMRDFIQEVTGGGTLKPKIPTVSSRTTGTSSHHHQHSDGFIEGDDQSAPAVDNVAVTPLGIDLEATLFTELVTSASSITLLDSIEASIITFLGKKQREYCSGGVSTSMWTLHTDAIAFARNAIFESVVVARLNGDVQLELIGVDEEEERGCKRDGGCQRCPNSLLSASFETLEGEVLQAIIRRKVASAFMAFSHLLEAW